MYTTINFVVQKSVHSELVQQLMDSNSSLEKDKTRLKREMSELSERLSAMEREVCGCLHMCVLVGVWVWVCGCVGVWVHGCMCVCVSLCVCKPLCMTLV